ncbi:mutS protein homolog 5-like [Paramacrobiotus metropolitanus]|uniref:mutS protein homolog 5-like n=1 Tax=Paramacrobiotus metropolitanus TaxID=2943436 RepID=UPI0024460503|nr:mutS protein homolog 5-like [Paramacrobiotus metropolitanus]
MASITSNSATSISVRFSSDTNRRTYFPDAEKAASDFALRAERESLLPDVGAPLLLDSADQTAIYLAIVWHAGILGAAMYNAETATIDLLMDVHDSPPFEILRALIANTKPGHLIFGQNTEPDVKEYLMRIGQNQDDVPTEDEVLDLTKADPPQLNILPNKDFALGLCKQRIDRIRLPAMPAHFVEVESIRTYLASLVDFRRIAMVRALGGLLHYLDKHPPQTSATGENNPAVTFPIVSLRMFSMEDSVSIDENSQRALRIFHADTHPSVFQAGKAKKEGLSVFALFNRCKSPTGSKLLRYWFNRPTRNFAVIRERHQGIRFFMSDSNAVLKKEFEKLLGNIKDVARSLGRMAKGASTLADWSALQKTASCAFGIAQLISDESMPQDIEIFGKIVDNFTGDLARVAKIIEEVIDFEASAMEERFVVNPNIAPELDELKQMLHNLNETLTYIAAEELVKMTDGAREIRVTYIPHLGYLTVLQETEDLAQSNYELPGLDFVFKAKNGLFYKSDRMRQLDEEYGDIVPKIHDCEQIIMIQLQEIVLRYSKLFLDVMKHTAELDCVIAIASVGSSRSRSYCIPVMGEDVGMEIMNARHPLQEFYVNSFIPNHIHVEPNKGRITIVTGPNMSGKSVYLKQMGLIVFLAHIGCPVPAERARIAFVDKIFTRLLTEETVALRQSAFLIDLTQVAFAVNYATRRSLIILDEFGKGTRATDGLALVAAILNHFISDTHPRQAEPSDTAHAKNASLPARNSETSSQTATPIIFLATHFHALDELVPPSDIVVYKKMQHTTADGGQMVFLFKVDNGKSSASHAVEISRLAGFPQKIVDRIHEVAESIKCNRAIKPVVSLRKTAFCEKANAIMMKLLQFDPVAEDGRAFLDNISQFVRNSDEV